jgi:23S rRNA pseudouridine2605 synthase
MHPRYEVEREYSVRVVGELTDEQTDALLDGVELEDGPARFMRLEEGEFSDEGPGVNRWYRVMIREGRNREVRRMFEAVGVMVSRLIRTRFGPIALPRGLHRGQSRLLTPLEVKELLKGAPGVVGTRDAAATPGPAGPPGLPGNGAGRGRAKPGRGPKAQPRRGVQPGVAGRQGGPAKRVRGAAQGTPGAKKGPAGRRGKKGGGIDRSALTLDGRRPSNKVVRRRDDDYVPPPAKMPVITHRRSKLKLIPPADPPTGDAT